MRIGSKPPKVHQRAPQRAPQSGFGYLALLGVLALVGAAMAAAGTAWSTLAQREREAELRFRGEQIRIAIARYRASDPVAAWPSSLEDLLEDRRGGRPLHHLRRLWADPFTGRPDWELIRAAAPGEGIRGVRSRSGAERLTGGALSARRGAPGPDGGSAAAPPRVSDWVFEVRDPLAPPPRPPQTAPAALVPLGRPT